MSDAALMESQEEISARHRAEQRANTEAQILHKAIKAVLDFAEHIKDWTAHWDQSHGHTAVRFSYRGADFCCSFDADQPEHVLVTGADVGGAAIMLQRALREHFARTS